MSGVEGRSSRPSGSDPVARRPLTVALLAMVVLMSVLAAPAEAGPPGKKKWLKDTRSAMSGSRAFVDRRVQRGGGRLAVNLDIDNTSLATYYKSRGAVPVVLRFAKFAHRRGVAVVFNTGRDENALAKPLAWLRAAGYPVAAICGRRTGEDLAASKQRCRQQYADAGYTIIANVGNRRTDFVGGNYERAFRLPNYGNRFN